MVEDVRSSRRTLAEDLGAVGQRITELLEQAAEPSPRRDGKRGVSES